MPNTSPISLGVRKLRSGYSDVIGEHETWLRRFGTHHAGTWQQRVRIDRTDYVEGMIWEALVRHLLAEQGLDVEPYEGKWGGPDFICRLPGRAREPFYVESRVILIEKVVAATRIPADLDEYTIGEGTTHDVQELILETCQDKVKQASTVDYPVLIATGTLHEPLNGLLLAADVEDLLQGRTFRACDGKGHSGEYSEPGDTAFLLWDPLEHRPLVHRHSIAGMLICRLEYSRPIRVEAKGVLHPEAEHVFDCSLLPRVPFYELTSDYAQNRLLVRQVQ